MKIPLPKMMRHWREREFERGNSPWMQRLAVRGWAFLAKRPKLYRRVVEPVIGLLGEWGKARGVFRWLPLAGGWLRHRNLPAPDGRTFRAMWRDELGKRRRDAEIGL